MAKTPTHELINTFIGLVALLLSGFSCWYTYYINKASKEEKVILMGDRVSDNYPTIIYGPVWDSAVQINLLRQVVIINNSDKPISIVQRSLVYKGKDSIHMIQGHPFNRNPSNNVGFCTPDYENADFPINISSGESRKLYVQIPISCGIRTSQILRKMHNSTDFVRMKNGAIKTRILTVSELLRKYRLDLFDNEYKDTTINGEYIENFIHYNNRPSDVELTLTTSNNTVVKQYFSLQFGSL